MKNATGSIQHAVVFGGASDIGLAVAARVADDGLDRLVLAARRPFEAEQAWHRDHGRVSSAPTAPTVVGVHYDATERGSAAKVLDEARTSGDVDLVVIAVGHLGDDSHNHDPGAAVDLLETNLVGPAEALIQSVETLTAQGHGQIVVLSSVAGRRVRGALATYGAAKAGLDGLAQGLQDRLAGSSVSITIVRPGFVASKMTDGLDPAPFATDPSAVADDTVAALADGRDVVWSPPILRGLFAGLEHLPRPVWRKVSG